MNDSTAFATYYDQITLHLHPQSTLDLELSLIQSQVAPGASILDIGCGTGRHLVPLQEIGYRVTGVEPNPSMREALFAKFPAARVAEADFLQLSDKELEYLSMNADLGLELNNQPGFDAAICMWNSICEICHTEDDLKLFAERLAKSLKPTGKLLVHLDLPAETHNYQFAVATDGFEYRSEVRELNEKTTTSIETLLVTSEGEQTSERLEIEFTQDLVQTWWQQSDLEQAWNGILKFESGGPLARRSGQYLWFSLA
jgi:SAM-dependent methyltransferase